jgi:hypothetical protein
VRAADQIRAIMVAPIRELADQGRLYADDVDAVNQSLWSLLHGLISLRIGNPSYPLAKNLFEIALDALLRGSVRPASPSGSRSSR